MPTKEILSAVTTIAPQPGSESYNDCACPQPAKAETTESNTVFTDSADPIQVEPVLPKI